MNNLLGIDYGERYIGVAIKLENVSVPYAHKVLDAQLDNLNKELTNIIKKNNINKIVIGYPIGLNTGKTRMSNNVDIFIQDMLKEYDIPIVKIDERMTSKILNKSTSKRIDDLSALAILETFINNE